MKRTIADTGKIRCQRSGKIPGKDESSLMILTRRVHGRGVYELLLSGVRGEMWEWERNGGRCRRTTIRPLMQLDTRERLWPTETAYDEMGKPDALS